MSVTIFPPLKYFPPLPYCPLTIFTPSSRPVVGGKNCWLDGKPKFLHASRVISPPLVQKKSAPAPCKPFFHYMYCLPGAVRGFQMGWVKISVVVVTNATKIFTLPTLGFSKLTYYVNHTCRIFLWQQEPTFSQVTSNDQHTQKFHQKHLFDAKIFAWRR